MNADRKDREAAMTVSLFPKARERVEIERVAHSGPRIGAGRFRHLDMPASSAFAVFHVFADGKAGLIWSGPSHDEATQAAATWARHSRLPLIDRAEDR